jgi:hypothetical protein
VRTGKTPFFVHRLEFFDVPFIASVVHAATAGLRAHRAAFPEMA